MEAELNVNFIRKELLLPLMPPYFQEPTKTIGEENHINLKIDYKEGIDNV